MEIVLGRGPGGHLPHPMNFISLSRGLLLTCLFYFFKLGFQLRNILSTLIKHQYTFELTKPKHFLTAYQIQITDNSSDTNNDLTNFLLPAI